MSLPQRNAYELSSALLTRAFYVEQNKRQGDYEVPATVAMMREAALLLRELHDADREAQPLRLRTTCRECGCINDTHEAWCPLKRADGEARQSTSCHHCDEGAIGQPCWWCGRIRADREAQGARPK